MVNGMLRRAMSIGVVIVLATLVMTACQEKRIAWRGQNVPGRIAYGYSTIEGDERGSIDLDAGETLVLEYDVEVEWGTA